MTLGRLTRITKTEASGTTRSNEITGSFNRLPKNGEGFSMLGVPIDPDASVRIWSTSPVVEILGRDGLHITFKTESGSLYRLDIEPEVQS